MRLVRNNREVLTGELAALLRHFCQGEGEGLQGDADDGHAGGQCLDELLRFGIAAAARNGLEGAGGGDELVDGVLELLVEYLPVGDDDDGVKDALALWGMEVGEPVGCPGDGVGFAGARRVLHQVFLPDSFGAGCLHEFGDGPPLVVAGESDVAFVGGFAGEGVGDFLVVGVDEFGEDGNPGVGLEDFFPEVAGGEFAVDDGVACAAVGSAVEGEEVGCFSCQFGGHGDFVLGEGEVDEGAAVFLEQG